MTILRKGIIPLLAVAMFGVAVRHAVKAQQTQQTQPAPPPPVQPARTPYGTSVAGAGLERVRALQQQRAVADEEAFRRQQMDMHVEAKKQP